jgi:hypothetical protein
MSLRRCSRLPALNDIYGFYLLVTEGRVSVTYQEYVECMKNPEIFLLNVSKSRNQSSPFAVKHLWLSPFVICLFGSSA